MEVAARDAPVTQYSQFGLIFIELCLISLTAELVDRMHLLT